MQGKQLSELVDMNPPENALNEVHIILRMISSDFDFSPITKAFTTVVRLFTGNYPGYRACNTEYHDLHHTLDAFLAMSRVIHGAWLHGEHLTHRHIVLSLICALFHDTGYIQEEHDIEGTGAKYTADHVERSAEFLTRHGSDHGLSEKEIEAGRAMIFCTDMGLDISTIVFPSEKTEFLGRVLCSADLMAQLADRAYLEKLLFLYHEFREAEVGEYEDELDLLRKTAGFYDLIGQRLEAILASVHRFMALHFESRWNLHANLYQSAIEKQKDYLFQILSLCGSDPFQHLRRGGIVEKVREKYGEDH